MPHTPTYSTFLIRSNDITTAVAKLVLDQRRKYAHPDYDI
jgi:hypothetical protein